MKKENSLQSFCERQDRMYLQIAAQWDSTLNSGLTPEMVTPGSHKRVWWKCAEGHVQKTAIYSRTGKQKCGCPVCAGKATRQVKYEQHQANHLLRFLRLHYSHQLIQLNISEGLSMRTICPNRESFFYYIINPISLHMIASINPYIRTNKGYIQTRIAAVWAKI